MSIQSWLRPGVLLLLLATLAARAPAQAPASSVRLASALDSVAADEISADVHFIADDELGGRDTPSAGLRVAARFLRARLERLGWAPGARDGYFHVYELEQRRIDERASHVVVRAGDRSRELHLGRDYFLRSPLDLADLSTTGEVVFCGSGSDEDLAGRELAGRWALCFDSGAHSRSVRNRARDAGALGLIFAPGPDYSGSDYAERYGSVLERMRDGPVGPLRDEGRHESVYPMVLLTRESAAALLELAGASAAAAPELGAHLPVEVAETRRLAGAGGKVEVENVCGFWRGSDPKLASEVVIVSAHYDHIGKRGDEVFNGADDNGSGTCGLLALAEALTRYGPMRRSVLLVWVSGEEKGLYGSKAWVKDAWLPEGCHAIADINLDMIGRNAPDQLHVTPTRARAKDYNGLVRLLEANAPLEGFPVLGSADEYYDRSDHASFAQLGIPVSFLFADVHEDYHGPDDTADKLDYDKVRRVVRLVVRVLDGLQADELDL